MNGGECEWSVEEEAGQREEECHPHIQPGQQTSEAGERVGQPTEKGDVVDNHREHRHGSEPFQCGQPAIRTADIRRGQARLSADRVRSDSSAHSSSTSHLM